MNWKLIVIGGVVFYLVMFVISFATGPLIHTGVLNDSYRANESFWRPELNEDPPNMGALMLRWVTTGVLTSLVLAAIFGWIRPALGTGWVAGAKFGVLLTLVAWCFNAGWSGIFNLPNDIWMWWSIEVPIYYVPGGAVLGWLGEKLAPSS